MGHSVGGREGMSYAVCMARLGLADTILGLSTTVPSVIFILELLLWVKPTLESLFGLWVGSWGSFHCKTLEF